MSRQSAVLRRLIKVSAVALGAGLVVTACSPVKLGSAAIVGNERITIATLDTEVTNLSRTVKLYPGTVQLSQEQQTQQTLTWLIRFKINDELARQAGITVSTARGAEGAGGDLLGGQGQRAGPGDHERHPRPHPGRQRDPAEPGQRGRPLPGHRQQVRGAGQRGPGAHQHGRAVGHRRPSSTRRAAVAAKALKRPGQPPVRPAGLQPGRGRRRARDGGPAGRAGQGAFDVGADAGLLIVLATSPRVAPGLLSWPAWEALRSAAAVLAPAGHPLLPALDEAGIGYRVAGSPIPMPPWRGRHAVVWLPEPGERAAAPAGGPAAARLGRPARRAPARPGGDHGPAAGGCPWDARQTHAVAGPAPAGGAVRGAGGARVRRRRRPSARNSATCCCRWCSTPGSRPSATTRLHDRRRGRRDRGQAGPAASARVRGRDGLRRRRGHAQLGRDQTEKRRRNGPNGPGCPPSARRPAVRAGRRAVRPARPGAGRAAAAPGGAGGRTGRTGAPRRRSRAPIRARRPARRSAATCSAWC